MSINLDNDEQCILCDLSYAHLDEFMSTQFKVLACRMTRGALYKTLWQYLECNRHTQSLQGNNVPDISVEELERHFEYHHVSIERTIVEQARKTQALQERLSKKLENKLDERNVKLFIQLSNHRIALTKKMKMTIFCLKMRKKLYFKKDLELIISWKKVIMIRHELRKGRHLYDSRIFI